MQDKPTLSEQQPTPSNNQPAADDEHHRSLANINDNINTQQQHKDQENATADPHKPTTTAPATTDDPSSSKQTNYMRSMHNWARKATETMRALEEQCKSVAAHQAAALQRDKVIEQLMAENEANQKAIQQLHGVVATLIDQVWWLYEKQNLLF